MRLVLIRHGESRHGSAGVIAGVTGCAGLTERGFAQARLLADRLSSGGEVQELAILASSPVPRARQTADVLAAALAVPAIEDDCGLCEVHPGRADGLRWEEYRETFGEFDLLTSPDRVFAPGGESWSMFAARVRETLGNFADRFEGRTVVAVTHAGFIVASFLAIFDIPRPGTGARLDPAHTSLTEWQVADGVWRLVRYNDTRHLDGAPTP